MMKRALTAEIEKAIQDRVALLFSVVCEAESKGASQEVIEQHFTEELQGMRAALAEIYPPERVEAIVEGLLIAYSARSA
jgi:hypothetical protein